jgi:very-short-patch-repair endonuclease
MTGTFRHDHQRLADLLRRQKLVLRRDQALACGLPSAALAHRLRTGGPWQKLLPGVYLAMTGPASAEQREMAALLFAGPRSVLTGLAAARRHGLRVPDDGPVDVLVPVDVRRHGTGFVWIQRTTRMPADVCVAGEVPFALPARAVADAARGLSAARDVRALVAQAIQQQRCSIELLTIELEQGPAKGSALLRAALEEVRAGVRSAPEGDLRRLIQRGRIPVPVFNARLYVGDRLLAVVDAWWEEAGVGAEVDSKAYHYSAGDWQRTMARHDRLVAQGVLLLHFTPRQIRTEPEEVAAQIRAALATGRDRARLRITTKPSG